jgi:hypothetical protein
VANLQRQPDASPPTPGLLKTTMDPMEAAPQVFPTIATGNDDLIQAEVQLV